MSAGTSPSDHQQLSVDDQTEGLFERQAMLEGRSYNVNSWLIRKDREQCKVLLEKLNDDSAEALLLFSYMILSIFQLRPISGHLPSARNEKVGGPQGTTGDDLSVNAPFTCEFGYNLHFGSDVKIGANCYMNDASTISIGNRVRIGRNVRFECNPQVSAKLEKGIAIAREIRIGDGVVIGDNVTIFGGVIIGVGSQICANIMLTQVSLP